MDKQEALARILRTYDAFYIVNKYDVGKTHKEEFEVLENAFKGNKSILKVIDYVKHYYDCYYEEEMKKNDEAIKLLIDEVAKWKKL